MQLNIKQQLSSFKEKAVFLPIKLLEKRDRILLGIVLLITISLAFLDLIGVLLVGVIGSLSITGISTGQTGNRVSRVLSGLRLNNFELESQVVIVGLIVAVLLICKTLVSLYLINKTLFFMARKGADISSNLISKLFTIPVSQLNQRSTQLTIYALTGGVNKIMVGVLGVGVALISDIALLFVMGVGLFFVDPVTACFSTLMFGLLALYLYSNLHKKIKRLGERQGILGIESSQRISEAVSSYRELLVRDRRGFYIKHISDLRYSIAVEGASIRFIGNLSKYILEIALVVSALLLAFYQFSTTTVFRALATIAIFVAASSRIVPAILRLQQGFLGMKAALAEAGPTVSLIKELSDVHAGNFEVKPMSRNHPGFQGDVIVSGVSFSYDKSSQVLKNVDFQARAGEFTAIIGGSGAGKTTFVDVVLGAIEAQNGQVLISNMEPRFAFSKWPGAVSYVPQDSPVINGTIRDNLGLGYESHEIKDEYCWESLEIARLDEFVKTLPKQLDAQVGDRGSQLSGGQRQRLGIARAMMTRPKLLILDEATSSLDGLTEFEISEGFKNLKGETTLIVIAHRLSTLVGADNIYFMVEGRFKGNGKFEELKNRFPEFLRQAELMGL